MGVELNVGCLGRQLALIAVATLPAPATLAVARRTRFAGFALLADLAVVARLATDFASFAAFAFATFAGAGAAAFAVASTAAFTAAAAALFAVARGACFAVPAACGLPGAAWVPPPESWGQRVRAPARHRTGS